MNKNNITHLKAASTADTILVDVVWNKKQTNLTFL